MRDIVAIVFDFDDTLAPDSTTGYLRDLGVDAGAFWDRANRRIAEDGWDPIPVYLYQMLELAQTDEYSGKLTRDSLADWGKRLPLHKGVTTFFGRLQKHVAEVNPDATLEFYLISSGVGEILRATKIAKHFKDIWACDFEYDEDGGIVFPKNVISFTEKTRFLFNISKGLIGEEARQKPEQVNRRVAPDDFRVPFKNMIFVGDGYTDIPCFALVRRYDGKAFAVYDPEKEHKWDRAWGFVEDNRVTNLLPADYGSHSALEMQLKMALSGILKRR